MCEIMTIVAAAAFTAVYFTGRRSKAAFAAMMMFWGAALMWLVDCTCSAMKGEGFFDISLEDTWLGFIVLAAGLAVFGAMSFFERRSAQAGA